MRGKYRASNRRIFTGSGYKAVIGVIIAMAIALVTLLLVFLPVLDDEIKTERTIVSIENTAGEIGIGSDLSKILVTVTYSDGTSEIVSIASMTHEGLDVSVAGNQNLSLSYGGFEQVLPVKVVDIDCVLNYNASVGGRIQGAAVQSVVNGGDAATVIAVPETGYVFYKWNDGFPYATRKDYGVTENKTYIAIFEKAKYTVRFYYDDGTVASEEKVTFGEAPTKIPKPASDPKMQKYGYTFSNWVPMEFSVIDRNMVIYPEYVKTATDVIVDIPSDQYGAKMGTTDARKEGYYAHNSYATITATPFNSREFAYWLVETSSGEYKKVDRQDNKTYEIGINNYGVNFNSTTSGSSVSDYVLSFYAVADIAQVKIKAVFAYSESSVTFINYQNPANNNVELFISGLRFGKSLAEYETSEISFADGMPLPNSIVGLQFSGWFLENDATQTVVGTDITFEQPARLIAKWKKLQYDIVFRYSDNGGAIHEWHRTKVMYQDTFASGTNGGLPLSNPTLENYIFVGWQDALTAKPVDDKTKLYAQQEYLEDSDFMIGKTLYMIPIWTPKPHDLFVNINGSGRVVLVINEGKKDGSGKDLSERVEDIRGNYTIYETNTYTLYFEALTGFELKSLRWSYGENVKTDDFESDVFNNKIIYVDNKFDNDILVTFGSIQYSVDIDNGDYSYNGLITNSGSTFDSSEISLTISYNSTLELFIESPNSVYAISDIIVSGKAAGSVLSNYSYKDYLEESTVSYTLVLDRCLSNLQITVTFATRECVVNVANLDGGEISEINFYNMNQTTAVESQTTFTYGENVFYKLTATDSLSVRKYISAIRINGSLFDMYTAMHSSVRFFNWEVNQVSQGISIMNINGSFYYNYGSFEYNSDTYVYCESLYGNSPFLFNYSGIIDDDTVFYEIGESYLGYENVLSKGRSDLSISNRSVYSTQIKKDSRITSICIMLTVTENFNLSFSFEDIDYDVTVASDEKGTYTVSNTNPKFKGASTVTATPITGYYITGYYRNGGDFQIVDTAERGDTFSISFTEISEDINMVFVYEDITYKASFLNNSSLNSEVFVNGSKLNNSYTFVMEYHSAQVFEIALVTAGKRISKLLINDVMQEVHYNMTTYVYIVNNMVEDISIELWCMNKEADSNGGTDTYAVNIQEEFVSNASVSAQYLTCDMTAENLVKVIADTGYTITSVSITGYDEYGDPKLLPFDSQNAGSLMLDIVIPADYFSQGEVSVTVSTSQNRYNMQKSSTGNGTLGMGGFIYHGEIIEVIVSSEQNNYIASFKINGEEISFSNSNWSNLSYNNAVKKYNYGIYSFIASEDVNIEAVFAINSYDVIVDAGSINGNTVLSVSGRGVVSKAFYGENLNITMTANVGYHIAAIYINSELITDYVVKSDTINANITDAYLYMGKKVGASYSGIVERTIVKVVYEINRYSFTYTLTNASHNFALDNAAGTLTSANYALSGNVYNGIEHGSNFSFDLTPTIGNGYYVYSIYIKYKSAYSGETEEVTRYFSDLENIVNAKGGTVWFNRFMGFEEGVTANIELINVTFKRNLYSIDLILGSAQGTGSMDISYTNRSYVGSDVIMLTQEGDKYYYRPDNKIYTKSGTEYVLSNIALTYDSDTGSYIYKIGEQAVTLYIEHGIQYTAFVQPTLGYARTAFTVNGENRASLVFDNKYFVNLTRDTEIRVIYTILTYTITYSTSVIDKNLTGRISNALIKNYMDISIKNMDTDGITALAFGADKITLTANYGVKLQFIALAKFGTTGYYLYNMYANEMPITNFYGNVEGEVIYGGANYAQGLTVTGDINVRVSFRIRRYSVTSRISYAESIVNESANNVREESGDTIPWGDAAYVKITKGDGYNLDAIAVKRGTNPYNYVILNPDPEIINNLTEQMYYNAINQNTNERRDVLKIVEVKNNIDVVVYLVRKEFSLRYVINNVSNLNNISTTLNAYNNTYPTSNVVTNINTGTWESGHINILDIKYYDEIAAIITPKNGYKIKELLVTVRAVRWDEDTGSWITVLDQEGNEIIYTINFTETYNDSRSFTFHNPSSPIAMHNVKTDLEMTFTVVVKTYTVKTDVYRGGLTNDTSINMAVKDVFGNNIILSDGNYQYAQNLTPASAGAIYIAEHHGFMLYTFDVPNGYMLSKLTLNGLEYDAFKTPYIINDYFTYNAQRKSDGYSMPYYSYSIRIPVVDRLIAGKENYIKGQYDVNISFEIVAIVYSVKVFINGVNYQSAIIDNRTTVTDSATLKVYVPATTTHFDNLRVEPSPLTGYRVTGLNLRVGSQSEDLFGTGYIVGDFTAIKNLNINSSYLIDSDVLQDTLTIYLYYTSAIKTYQVNIGAYAYSYDESLVGAGNNENVIPLSTGAGMVSVYPTTATGGILEYAGVGLYEYFSNIRFEAYANEGYALFMVEEYVVTRQDGQGNDVYEWKGINNNLRGLTYNIVTELDGKIKHIVNYMVDDHGNRQFRVVYKQKTTVTVYVTSPYKYVSGSVGFGMMNYYYYATVTAKENGAILNSVYDNGSNIVKDTYVYNVYVGNRISLSYKDTYQKTGQTGYSFRVKNGDNYVVDAAVVTENGTLITSNLEYYLYTDVYSRVTFEKKTNGANSLGDGGMVVFNNAGSESANYSVCSAATITGKILNITVKPNSNYIFTAMKVHQIDNVQSKIQGKIVYLTGVEEWLVFDPSTFDDQDTNNFNITRTIDAGTGYVNYRIVMRGDMELRFEFYRVYEIEYTANYTDKTAINGGNLTYYNPNIAYSEIAYSEENDNVAVTSGEKYKVSYDSSFKLTALPAPDNYVFVGWYINGINTYEYLDSVLPGNDYTSKYFYINLDDMGGLIVNNNEVVKLSFVAMYQPIINVGLINELYHYNTSTLHWNSWQSGALEAEAYNFDGTAVPYGTYTNKVINTTYTTVQNTKNIYQSKLPDAVDSANWSLFEGIPNSNNIYSKIEVLQLLYQNVKDYEFINNSWENGKIILNMTALSTTVHFTNWQYYNWSSGEYEDITYSYSDASYGLDGEGNPVSITCYYEYYRFDMSYLYSGNMPYAICSDSADNANNTLPLIIRPSLWKSVAVELTKYAYINYLGGNLQKNFSSIISPTIDRNSIVNSTELHTSTSDDGLKGEYDYGATIKIMYYSVVDGFGNVLDYTQGGVKYRFLGWFLNWKVSNQIEFRMISDDNSMAGYDLTLQYNFGDEPPNDSMELRATYVTQYKQSLFSYNIAGGTNYSNAYSAGTYAVKDAPSISTVANVNTVQFAFYNIVTGAISTVSKSEIKTDITANTHVKEFYIDVGTDYNVSLNFTQIGDAESLYAVATGGNMSRFGFDPDYDMQHKILRNGADTGTVVTFTGEDNTASAVYKLEVQYYTKALLSFTNIMYKAGIKVPLAIANNLTGNSTDMTVWDIDTAVYGDGKSIADGIVKMIINLNESGINYHGRFDYSPYGYKDGYGIPAVRNLVYPYINSSGQTVNSDQMLFNPADVSYRRSIIIDYSNGYMSNGSLLFGNPSWPTPSTKYTVSNVGDGTSTSPYKIYNSAQLQNLGLYYNYNGYSCINDVAEQIYFKLFANIQLQSGISTGSAGVIAPYINSKAWVPICYYFDSSERIHYGFDGHFDGGGFSLYGLAADGIANLTPIDSIDNPLANFDYTNLAGYGIFGCINGGVVENLNLGNAYINMQTFSSSGATGVVSYVGILAARVYNSVINNITFTENAQVVRYGNATYGTARVYINAMDSKGLGLIAGYMENTRMDTISVTSSASGICIELLGGTSSDSATGGIVGQLIGGNEESNAQLANNLSINISNSGIVLINYQTGQNFTNSGGIFGSVVGGYLDINDPKVEVLGTASKLYVGNTSSINVGGIAGMLSGKFIKMLNPLFTSNGTVNTTSATNIKAEYEQNSTVKEGGVFLTASAAAPDSMGDAIGVSGESSYGKAGALVGLNKNAKIESNLTYSIKGGVYFFAGTAGGIVGVNCEGVISKFALFTKNSDGNTFKMYFRNTTLKYSNYGGIAGANVNLGVIDDCSFVNTEATKESGETTLGGTYMYVFRKDGLTDKDYQTIQAISEVTTANKRKKVIPNILTVGGLVGYNTGGVYNSFIKKSRITVNYYNGAAETDYQWVVTTGGIVGFHDAKAGNSEGSYYGSGSGFYPDNIKFISRVQSCYTVGMSIVVLGHVWVDNNTAFPEQTLLLTGKVAATIGGIAGGTNDTLIGQYAISNCYVLRNKYILKFNAWGLSNTGAAGAADVGWYYDGGTVGIGKVQEVNRKGFYMDGNIFAICSGYKLEGGGGSFANYCWSQGNSADRNTPLISTNASEFAWTGGWFDDPPSGTPHMKRGLDYTISNDYGNILAYWNPGLESGSTNSVPFVAMPSPSLSEVTIGSTTIYPSILGADGNKPLYAGGFVGVVGAWDGRVYRTDPTTGLLVMWHLEADVGSADTCIFGYGTETYQGYPDFNYAQIYTSADYLTLDYLVRGQLTGTGNRLNNNTYGTFESYNG